MGSDLRETFDFRKQTIETINHFFSKQYLLRFSDCWFT